MSKLDEIRDEAGNLPSYAWPGGYPVLYVMGDGGTLCPECANGKNGSEASASTDTPADWRIDAFFIHYEGPADYCDHCGKATESAYGDPADETAG